MLSLRVVHNFVNKFLKCSARLRVSGAFVTPARRTGCAAAEAADAGSALPRRFGFRRSRCGSGSPRFLPAVRARQRPALLAGGAAAAAGPASPGSFQIRPPPALPRLLRARCDVSLNILIFLGLIRTPHPGAAAFPAGIGTLWVCGRG